MKVEIREVATPHGPGRLHVTKAPRPVATLLLGHGAGGGVEAPDLVALATHLPRSGITVMRYEQPWRVAGRKVAPAPAVLDVCLTAAVRTLRIRTPLLLGGRSAGARSACRLSAGLGAGLGAGPVPVGVLALSFPLHPPGKPEKSRLDELTAVEVPVLVVQGERDPFGGPQEFPEDTELTVVPGGDHSFRVPKRVGLTAEETMSIIVEAVLEWVASRTVSPTRGSGS
ncbi:MAG: hydrolase [Nocardioidaceae bacterium]